MVCKSQNEFAYNQTTIFFYFPKLSATYILAIFLSPESSKRMPFCLKKKIAFKFYRYRENRDFSVFRQKYCLPCGFKGLLTKILLKNQPSYDTLSNRSGMILLTQACEFCFQLIFLIKVVILKLATVFNMLLLVSNIPLHPG